jgi:ELP3 family radical SAM enzyme/protein acetyltransferase
MNSKMATADLEEIIKKNASFEVLEKNYDKVVNIILEMFTFYNENNYLNNFNKKFNTKMMSIMRYNGLIVKKSILIYVYKRLTSQNKLRLDYTFISLLQKKPCRNISGITSITVLTSPTPDGQDFSCKHNCYYCPNEPGQPRSYLSKEPAVQRANRNNFDPCKQMLDRLNTLLMNGHNIDKLEIIIEGGTFTEYPKEYLEIFICQLIYTTNVYFDDIKRDIKSIEEEIKINENAKTKIIGICCETRPDCLIDENDGDEWLQNFRKWGITRVQIGVQHTNNDILKKINRGHKIEDVIKCIQKLKNNCFKVDIHIMPDLPYSNLEEDEKMMEYLYNSQDLQPDQIKLYPCEVVPWTTIEKWHKQGKYIPYANTHPKEFVELMKKFILNCPAWVRISRVIRDIPLNYISGGNKITNLRQIIEDQIKVEKLNCLEIRFRECGRHIEYKREDSLLNCRKYKASNATDYFLSFESSDNKALFGFLRLRLSNTDNDDIVFDELKNCALIRELHVYGKMLQVGFKEKNIPQHTGLGKELLKNAESIARENNYKQIAVISGIGVTKYYKKFGYNQVGNYMIKDLVDPEDDLFKYISYMMLLMLFFPFILLVSVCNSSQIIFEYI